MEELLDDQSEMCHCVYFCSELMLTMSTCMWIFWSVWELQLCCHDVRPDRMLCYSLLGHCGACCFSKTSLHLSLSLSLSLFIHLFVFSNGRGFISLASPVVFSCSKQRYVSCHVYCVLIFDIHQARAIFNSWCIYLKAGSHHLMGSLSYSNLQQHVKVFTFWKKLSWLGRSELSCYILK